LTSIVLRTANLILREPQDSDLEGWAQLDANACATEFIGGVKTRAEAWMGLATAVGMWRLRGCGLFSVLEASSGRWLGRVGPWFPEGAIGTEVGWAMLPSEWGKGRATEAAEAAINWAVAHLNWAEVIHCIHAENAASISLAQRLGSVWREQVKMEGGAPVQIYGQSKTTWRNRKADVRRET
jgi:RimJ/RimL family protein N-acetyltransferase